MLILLETWQSTVLDTLTDILNWVVQVCFDKSDLNKSDFRKAGRICGNGYIFGGFAHVTSDPKFDESDIFRWDSEVMETHKAANALSIAHSRPFTSSFMPTEAPSKITKPRRVSEICTTGEELRSSKIHKHAAWEWSKPGSPWCLANAWTTPLSRAL